MKAFISATKIEGATVIPPAVLSVLPPSLQRHADLGICIVSPGKAVCPPDSYEYYKKALQPYGYEIIEGSSPLTCNYPGDSAYNVCVAGKKCFLNKKVCDKLLLDILTSEGYEIIDVRQGYTKCSICPIDENSIITADISIEKAAKEHGMDVLLISNDTIVLDGYNNGFFGGCTGMDGDGVLLVNGDINTFPQKNAVKDFLLKKRITLRSLKEGELVDIGSILPLLHK